jgi:hypothetical protein
VTDGPAPLRAKAFAGASWLALRVGDYEAKKAFTENHLATSRALGDQQGVAGH